MNSPVLCCAFKKTVAPNTAEMNTSENKPFTVVAFVIVLILAFQRLLRRSFCVEEYLGMRRPCGQ